MTPLTIAISPGHTPTQPGATRGHISEYGLSSAIIGDSIFRLSKLGHVAHLIGSQSNTDQVQVINEINPDFGFELHFNSVIQADSNGSLVMHAGSQHGIALASAINKRMVSALRTRNAGIYKAHWQLDKRRPLIEMVKNTWCPFVVVEPLYLSNDDDFERIDIPLISIALVEGCIDYWSEVGS